MLIKINQLKKVEIMVSPEIPERIKALSSKASSLGYNVDISTSISKFLDKELNKIEEQLEKEINGQGNLSDNER